MIYTIRRGELLLFGLFCLIAGSQLVQLIDHADGGRQRWLSALAAMLALASAAAVLRVIRARQAEGRGA